MSVQYRQNPAVEAASLQDETILLNPETNQFCILNHTASVIWSKVGQPATSEEIAAEVAARFADVSQGDALRDVEEALRQLTDRQLVTRV
jgi:Coenzyme PQQ synthesis protein D (PqqD)